MKTYHIFLDNEEGDQFFYEGPSSWYSDPNEAFVFDSIDEARGVIKQLKRVDYPWDCALHIEERESELVHVSMLAERNYKDRDDD